MAKKTKKQADEVLVQPGAAGSTPPQAPAPDLSYIHPDLRPLAIPIAELVPDPANARLHGEKNLASIRGSLAQFGQRRPAVVQRQGMIIRAGNGMVASALQLGWTHIAAIIVDEDNISATAFGIADNRTAELAEWDKDVLDKLLQDLEVGDENLQGMIGDLANELDLYLTPKDAPEGDGAAPSPAAEPLKSVYQVIVDCETDEQQKELLERMQKEGYKCRALIA